MSTEHLATPSPSSTSASSWPAAGSSGLDGRRRGLRLRPGRPLRVLLALVLMVAAVVAALTVYLRVGDRRAVLMLSRDVLAGEQLRDDALRVVAVAADDELAVVPAGSRGLVVGQYAKVRMVAGSLLAPALLQSQPLVDPARAVVALAVSAAQVPVGLREGSRLLVTVVPAAGGAAVLVEAFVVSPPRFEQGAAGSLTVQVPIGQVAAVTTATKIAVSVIDPAIGLPPGVNG